MRSTAYCIALVLCAVALASPAEAGPIRPPCSIVFEGDNPLLPEIPCIEPAGVGPCDLPVLAELLAATRLLP